MVMWSEEAKKIILIELTVQWEVGCEEAYEGKATSTWSNKAAKTDCVKIKQEVAKRDYERKLKQPDKF